MTKIELMLVAVIAATLIMLAISSDRRHPCLRSHVEMVHHPQLVTFIYVNKIMMPMVYPSYDSEDQVCDERRP